MLPTHPDSYASLMRTFEWRLPARFNIGTACADEPARTAPDRPAIIDIEGNQRRVLSFADLARKSRRLAAALADAGIGRGDRIAIMVPQSIEAAVAHLAVYRLGAIAVPMATQFGPDAIGYRLAASGARAFIAFAKGIERARSLAGGLVDFDLVVASDRAPAGAVLLDELIAAGGDTVLEADTTPDDPAMMLFTSGTTGQPKGTLHGHRVLLGHLPGIEMAQHFMPRPGDVFWTPSDWAWAGGLLNALLPALCHGVPVVAARAPRFEPGWALEVMRTARVTNVFLPPTALRMLLAADGLSFDGLSLRVIGTAGEALGHRTHARATGRFGVPVNEFYGQTECNAMLANCAALGVDRPGSMGRPVPGHEVAILRADGSRADVGEAGEVAVRAPDPVMFLGYWRDAEATRAKFRSGWLMTGDSGRMDAEGYFHFVSRMDDVITSSGYRIGPSEIEDCLAAHPDIEMAAVVGRPDPVRTEIVAAFVKLRDGVAGNDALKREIAGFVRARLSAHQYPREIHFVDAIPLTESGKVIRRHFRDG
ncbi:MAG: AMP-binding protein [Roseitalea porphyridii]|uniref:AMP-binding protein n=1 Tax=Roseitalea porphyridii TaxID=1852022 RepID=UPI0032D91A75